MAYNQFTDEPEITYPKRLFGGEDDSRVTEVYSEEHLRRVFFVLERDFFTKTTKFTLDDYLQDRARDRPYHPVHDYLNSIKWDGTPRIDRWLETYLGVAPEDEDTRRYVSEVGAMILMAAVRRIRRPGCKFDSMLVLEGLTNAGKSMALLSLAPNEDWVLEDFSLGVDAKIAIERTSGKWLVEVSEMVVSRKSDLNKIKAFLSLKRDVARKAYGRKTTKQPRSFVFVGTTNELHYLEDKTGNRRYWPVKCGGKVDFNAIARDRDQLWAEAQEREVGAKLYLTDDLFQIAVRQQSQRETPDAWEDHLASLCGEGAGWWRLGSIWNRLSKPIGQVTSGDSRRLSLVMNRLGFHSTVRYFQNHKRAIRVWLRLDKNHTVPADVPAILPEDKRWEDGREDESYQEPTFF